MTPQAAFGNADAVEDAEEIATPTRRFSLLETTSGLPDDSREAGERAAERRLRELRGRVKAARATISVTPGAEEVLRQDWVKAAQFYARFGITEAMYRHGVPADAAKLCKALTDRVRAPSDGLTAVRARGDATLPG